MTTNEYNRAEILNKLSSHRADLIRTLEDEAMSREKRRHLRKIIARMERIAESDAVSDGVGRAAAELGIEPSRRGKAAVAVAVFVAVLALTLYGGFTLIGSESASAPPEAAGSPVSVSGTSNALRAVAGIPDALATEVELTPEEVEAEILAIAAERGFKWPGYLVRLAKCESGLNPGAVNTHGNSPSTSTDRGIFQINNYHHPEVSDEVAFDLRLSTEWTMWRIESGYQHEWVCDGIIKSR